MKNFIETKRLILCEATLEDSEFFYTLLNSPNWIEFIGDKGVRTQEDAKQYIQSNLIDSYQKNGYGLLTMSLKESRKPIGICGFVRRDYLNSPDIGFAILPEHEGNGYTTEACEAIISYGKTELKLQTILGITTPENSKSRNLLIKIGLFEVGIIQPEKDKKELLLFSTKKATQSE
ncbi:GNAT family N-acetyltransferase [Flagellimonas sp. HMM57]|uniref:GNAT family N-acetyltransferase n=1 Tax=unclassified Flagellimonas TaxID=2644544 RepID=UPI0013D178ED|nr:MULTISPECIES: GNAT family N-acetyltransferase [unclassified Flagellimonas]UII75272.1 GNAT family N-acetyltransferase [Flagellimonas sp. HMM57]